MVMSNDLQSMDLGVVLDVNVQVTARLGSCEMPMKEIVALSPGTVLQLKQNAKDPVGLYVNNKLIALGEVVVVEDRFGIKVTEISEA